MTKGARRSSGGFAVLRALRSNVPSDDGMTACFAGWDIVGHSGTFGVLRPRASPWRGKRRSVPRSCSKSLLFVATRRVSTDGKGAAIRLRKNVALPLGSVVRVRDEFSTSIEVCGRILRFFRGRRPLRVAHQGCAPRQGDVVAGAGVRGVSN